jgi:hypothetical protein
MKYELRKDETAFTANPAMNRGSNPAPSDASSSPTRPPRPKADLAELANLYELEVFDLVRVELNNGHPAEMIERMLRSDDFSDDEAHCIVRAVIEDRLRRGIDIFSGTVAHVNPLDPLGVHRVHDAGDIESPTFRSKARRDQATRDVLIGMIALVAGIFLTLVTSGTRIFLGAVIVGVLLLFRGLVTYAIFHRE